MALKILNPGTISPLGQFDCLDADMLNIKGGEVATLGTVPWNNTADLAAYDEQDGYGTPAASYATRAVVTVNLPATCAPLFLTDDGTTGYGTLFGSLVGGVAGQQTSGAVLGPHTALGSGKVTLWGQEGLYATTLDAVDSGLFVGANVKAGDALMAKAGTGKLGLATGVNSNAPVARFVEFATDGGLVRTPSSLVQGINSPTSDIQVANAKKMTMVVFYWLGN